MCSLHRKLWLSTLVAHRIIQPTLENASFLSLQKIHLKEKLGLISMHGNNLIFENFWKRKKWKALLFWFCMFLISTWRQLLEFLCMSERLNCSIIWMDESLSETTTETAAGGGKGSRPRLKVVSQVLFWQLSHCGACRDSHKLSESVSWPRNGTSKVFLVPERC